MLDATSFLGTREPLHDVICIWVARTWWKARVSALTRPPPQPLRLHLALVVRPRPQPLPPHLAKPALAG